jgi:hypothetical protein
MLGTVDAGGGFITRMSRSEGIFGFWTRGRGGFGFEDLAGLTSGEGAVTRFRWPVGAYQIRLRLGLVTVVGYLRNQS